jgi:hypothetical protein
LDSTSPGGRIEENGIIYPADFSSPPQYQNGQADLYQYLENNVRITQQDRDIFDNYNVIVCYALFINSSGYSKDETIYESSIKDQHFDMQAGRLEETIRKTLASMPVWKPGIKNNKVKDANIYIPLKFRIEGNKIFIMSSKYLFVIKNRRN